MTIIYFALILSAIVIIHELGHLLTAKHFGIYCEEFSIGMGPCIYKKQFKETRFSIRALPIGGFVSMAGEEGIDDENIPFERTIKGVAWWKQIIVMAAGAVMNVLFAWVLFVGITMAQGKVSLPAEPVVVSFTADSAAQEAGFVLNDRILEVTSGSETVYPETFDEITEHISYYPDQETTFKVQRGDQNLTITLTPRYNEELGRALIGIGTTPVIKEISVLESFQYGTERMFDGATSIMKALSKLIRGIGLENLSGPVGIYQLTAKTTESGMLSTITLVALLSLNIGIFNLLPLPVLDGGRIFITLIEKISGRKLGAKAETAIMGVGVLLLVALMVFATWQDIVRLF